MTRFVPNNFKPLEKDILWAMNEFNISREEVDRQLELMIDHEFRRSYTDWNRVYRNWFRSAERFEQLRRERKAYKAEEYTEEDRKADAAKSWAVLNKLKGI